MSDRLIQSVDRAIDVIELFNSAVTELSVKEISDGLQLSKSTVHGLGLRCFAAPIFNHEGKVIASISCAGPINRVVYEKDSEIAKHVKAAALEISKKSGYR